LGCDAGLLQRDGAESSIRLPIAGRWIESWHHVGPDQTCAGVSVSASASELWHHIDDDDDGDSRRHHHDHDDEDDHRGHYHHHYRTTTNTTIATATTTTTIAAEVIRTIKFKAYKMFENWGNHVYSYSLSKIRGVFSLKWWYRFLIGLSSHHSDDVRTTNNVWVMIYG